MLQTKESEDFKSSGNVEKKLRTSCICHLTVAVFKMVDDVG